MRKGFPVLRRRKFFQGCSIRGAGAKDIAWHEPRGKEMTDKAWADPFARCLGVRLNGDTLEESDERGEPVAGDTPFLTVDAHRAAIHFRPPAKLEGARWERLLDTADRQWGRRYLLRDHG
jgi:isoamylase